MNATRKYLEHHAQETADAITGEIIERTPDGTYRYRDIATGAERFATANLGDDYTAGSRVRIDRVSASRGTIGAQDTILTRAPREQRGLSATTPAEERVGASRAMILGISPDPLEIYAGGEAGEQTFDGIGFDSQAAVYVSSYEGGPAPDLTNDAPPDVADTAVTMTLAAAVDSARGEFDAIVNGARARKALRILRPAPFSPQYGVFVMANSDTNELVSVAYVPSPAPWSTLDHVMWKRSAPLGSTIARIVQIDNATFLVLFVGGGGRVVTMNTSTGAFSFGGVGSHPMPWAAYAQIAIFGGYAYYGTGSNEYVEVNINSGSVSRVLLSASSAPYRGSLYHAGTDCLFTANALNVSGDIKIHKINRASGIDTTARLVGASGTRTPDVIAANGDRLLVFMVNYTSAPNTRVRKLLASTLGSGGETFFNMEPNVTGNGFAFVVAGALRLPLRSVATGASASRLLASVTEPIESASGWAGNPALSHEGFGAILVPAEEGPFGTDPFLWRLMRTTTGSPTVVLRGRDMRAGGNSLESIELHLSAADLPAASAELGLGWTAV